MLAMFIGGVNSAWAADKQNVSNVTTSFSATGNVTSNFTQSGDFTAATWSLDVTWKNGASWQAMNASKGSQVGSGSKPASSIILTGTNIPGTIKSVKVNSSVASGGATTVGVVVGSTTFQCNNASTATLQTSAADYTFTGEASGNVVLTWTQSSSSKAIYIKSVTITYEESDPSDTRAETTVTIDDSGITNTNVYAGTAAGSLSATVKAGDDAVSGASVTWSSDDTDVATIDASTGVVTLVGAGSTIITASFAGDETNYKPSTDTYELTVTNTDPNAPGTENNPYTVAQAIQNTPSSGTSDNVYIKGIVSKFYKTDIVSDGTNYRYYISDDGTENNQLLVYKGKGLNNVAFSSANDLQIGDEVVILGGLTTYNSTKEVATDNYIVSLTRKPTPTIKLVDEDETEVEDELNVQFDGQKGLDVSCFANDVDITNDVEITWTSADETIATYDGLFVYGLAMGTTTITFNFAGNADYRPVSKVLTVNVVDARTPVTMTFGEVPSSINVGETASYPIEEGYSVTYTSSDDNIVSVDEDGEITANEVGTATITATFDGDEMFQPASASYTITVVDPSAPVHVTQWVEVDPATLTTGDVVVIVDKASSKAMANDQGTSAAPTATNVTLNAAKTAITSEVDENIQWTVTVSGTDEKSYQFGVGDDFLYVTKTNNGLRVGDGTRNSFTIATGGDNSGYYLYNGENDDDRNVGCYNSSDWRCYGSINSNIKGNDNAFYKKVEEDCIPVTITSAGAASFSSKYALDFSKVSELTAYKATSKSDSYVHLDEVEQVPAGAGVIVKGAEGLYSVPVVTGDVAELEGNLLVGTGENTFTVTSAEYGKVFKYVKTNAGVVGFQKAKEGWTCQAGHAYLMLSEVQAREFIGIFGEDISTGINSIDNGQLTMDNDAPAYNLAGQKVGKGYKGIVVKNGKKYVK